MSVFDFIVSVYGVARDVFHNGPASVWPRVNSSFLTSPLDKWPQ